MTVPDCEMILPCPLNQLLKLSHRHWCIHSSTALGADYLRRGLATTSGYQVLLQKT